MHYAIAEHIVPLTALEIWMRLQQGLSSEIIIFSSKAKTPYTIHSISKEAITYSAPSRKNGNRTDLLFKDFEELWPKMKKLEVLNIDTIKNISLGTFRREHSPLFALLLAANVLEKQ